MRTLYKILLGFIPLLMATAGYCQTTISTTSQFSNNNGSGIVTFNLQNTNTSGIIITQVKGLKATAGNTLAEVWYKPTPINGLPGAISVANGWTRIDTITVTGPASTTVPVTLFTNLNFTVPANTTYGMAVYTPSQPYYTIPATPTTVTFSGGGVNLIAGANVSYGGGVPGPGGSDPTFTPRGWIGELTFIPALPCTAPPTAGTTTVSSSNVCSGGSLTVGLSGNSFGTGQTYQLLTASSASGPYTSVGAAQNGSQFVVTASASTFYRIRVVCGTGADTSSPASVTVPNLFAAGTYTINNSQPTAGSNFNSFTEAVAAISCGISGPVVFNVANNATAYNEQISIPNIATSSSANTVTFNGNGATIQHNSTSAQPAVITLNGADWVRIKRLTIRGLNSTSNWGVAIQNDANYNLVDSCNVFLDSNGTGFPTTGIAVGGTLTSPSATAPSCDTNTISNNTIVGGYYATTLFGNSASAAVYCSGNSFSNNVVRNFYFYGCYGAYATNSLFENNDYSRPTRTLYSTYYGIYLFTSGGGIKMTRNRFHDPSQNQPTAAYGAYAIFHSSVTGTAANPNEVSNNLIYNMRHDGFLYGFYNSSSPFTRYYHNTVSLDDVSSPTTNVTRGYYHSGTPAGVELKNNIFSLTRGGTGIKHALYIATSQTAATIYSARTNVYYAPNAAATGGGTAYYNATNYPTLAAYQAVALQDTGSVETNPVFVSSIGSTPASYIPTNASVNNIGVPTNVTTDIVLAPRSTTAPDPGAIEFTPAPCTTPPTAGTSTASNTAICGGTQVSFDITGNSYGLNQTYQWQTSPTAAFTTPTNVGTSSTLTGYSQVVTTTAYFRAAVTCGTSTTFSTPILVTVIAPLAGGTYTINAGAPASATNYQSFTAAVQAMQCGITGPVVMNVVAASGPYAEQVIFPPTIAGTSATSTITFNGNGNVVAPVNTNNVASRAGILLNGADWIRINNLTVNISSTGNTYGFGIQLFNDADNNIISGCTVNIDTTTGSSLFAGMVISGSLTGATTTGTAACDSNRFLNNIVNGGYYGMTNVGSSTTIANYNNVFRGNVVRNHLWYGIYGLYTNNWVVDSNEVNRANRVNNISSYYPIGTFTGTVGTTVSRNRVHSPFGAVPTNTNIFYGLYNGSDASTAQPNVFVNNRIYNVVSNGTQYGTYNSSADNARYVHNTFSLDDTTYSGSTVTYGMYQTILATGIDVRNNIFSLRRTGSGAKTALYFSTATTTFTSNYNDLYVAGGTGTNSIGYLTSAYSTLSAWQSGTGKDTNSVDADPQFAGGATGSNLTPTNPVVDNLGQPIGVAVDAFGAPRSLTLPDIGAIEWSFIPPCNVPTALSDAAAATTANVGWVGSTSTNVGYEFTYGTVPTPPTGAGTPVSGTSVPLSGLTPNTVYYYCVRTVCGPNSYSAYVCDSFKTCAPPAATLVALNSPTPTTAVAICQGDTAQLKAPGGAGNTYVFLNNGSVVGSGATPDSILRTNVAGSYRVVVTNATGCYDTSAAAGINVTVNPLPTPTIQQAAFNQLSAVGGTFTTYQWNLVGTGPVSGANQQTLTTSTNGSYTVTVTDANGCRATSTPYSLTTASVGSATGAVAHVRIFPNPTTGRVFIESSVAVRATVWTLDGRKLMDVEKASSIDLSALASGVYMLRLTDADGTVLATERLTKTN